MFKARVGHFRMGKTLLDAGKTLVLTGACGDRGGAFGQNNFGISGFLNPLLLLETSLSLTFFFRLIPKT